jgi:polyisoprenoid-binding protein YceI
MNTRTLHTTPTPAWPVGRYVNDPDRTTVRLHTRHFFGLGAVTGTVQLRAAHLTVAESPGRARLQAVADAASFKSGNPTRDAHVRADDAPVKITQIYKGTNQIQRVVMARQLLK